MKQIISFIKNNRYFIQFDRAVNHRFAVFGFIFILYALQFMPWMTVRNVAEFIIYFILLIVILRRFILRIKIGDVKEEQNEENQ